MDKYGFQNVRDQRLTAGVAPIFQLLGTGQLGDDAVDALMAVLQAEGLPTISQARLENAYQIASELAPVVAIRRPGPVERALAALDRAAVEGENAVRRLVASLVMDLRPFAVPAGTRSVASASCRLLFAADPYEVMLQGVPTLAATPTASGTPRRRGHDLAGQILRDGDPVPNATILLSGSSHHAETEADTEGGFRFPGLMVDRYELDVWAGNDLIVCAPVDLGDRTASPARW